MPPYLTCVFRDYGEDAWHTDTELLFDEDHVTQEMVILGISTKPGRKERHLQFEVSYPLTPIHVRELTRLKEAGMFHTFFISDEAPKETQPHPEHDHVQPGEGRAASVRKVQKLGDVTGRLIAAQTYPSIIREQDALQTAAHLLWDVLRGEEPAAEIFGLSFAIGYLEQVSHLDKQEEWLHDNS